MSEKPHHAVQDFLSGHRDNLTDDQIDEFYDRFLDLQKEIEEVAECDHENVVAHVPPNMIEREGGTFLSPTQPTGVITTISGKCKDCGASVSATLELTADTGGEDDE